MTESFGHYSSREVDVDDTRPMTLFNLDGEPELLVRYAGEANKPYFNELLRRNQKLARTLRGRALDTSIMEKTRDSDRVLYAKFIVTGWNRVVNRGGHPVEFTEDNCLAFLKALPPEEFDEVRAFCTNQYNFTGGDAEGEDEALGNS